MSDWKPIVEATLDPSHLQTNLVSLKILVFLSYHAAMLQTRTPFAFLGPQTRRRGWSLGDVPKLKPRSEYFAASSQATAISRCP